LPARRPPSVRARQLASEIRRLREVKMLTGEEAAAELGWSASKVSRIETGRSPVTVGDLRRLLDFYQVPGARRDRLIELARTADQRGWWDAYADTLPEGYSAMIALEADAESELHYQPSLLPGLLQTEAYMAEIVRSSLLVEPPGVVSERVEVRLTRQAVLSRVEDPLELTAVLDEAGLRRQVAGPEVMREQLTHLVEMSARPNITLQVLPFGKGSHPAMAGGFTILRFPGVIESGVVYLDNMTSDIFIESEAEVHHYRLAFDRLRELALPPQQSVTLITEIADRLILHQGKWSLMYQQGEFASAWRKSSYSGSGADCVEVAANSSGFIYARDSKKEHGPELSFTPTGWAEFIGQLKGNPG
jgi:transcriptional regulator with XRE-family HTH domain